ncbi:hypothetical protein VIBNISFn27_p10019 [Vibrio nigripulchritudo SFn27]|uniref:Transcriptional regulator IclR n=1 Tax=Vibrio nigripulchritudo TaxID=28173 RepID=A0A9P1JLE0_9VIBR|nr:IclR family transcriptional regulator [Vibrio nigripulchritudo]CBJ93069.1 Putative Transcriptional regulator IclR [Vibrio nigripulchritudo]CCN38612.1 hypothetical protein VIBNIAM115_p0013 [Vibrio nigripulchritudo AM115]CCN44921.1 hypothetical protein VIBNIFTn2_p0012 [Vibrio nigripulchritudo FTn2]CCN79676.1 hypothetical protein VIBNISO65_p0012 [Vibrio nigripulchritudo SO65]CCN85880.1 hypothetical protein VIBNIBLFn1_p0015 [Vibrio nigripulchritudo BLFn1]
MSNNNTDTAQRAEKESSSNKYSVPALDKALDMIELLARSREGASLTEISKKLDRPVATLYRVAQVLEQRGYIYSEGPKSAYRLSLKMYQVVTQHYPVQSIIDAASSEIRALAHEVMQSCHLAVLNKDDIMIVYQQDPPMAIHYSVAIGSSFPAITTSSGAVILAHSSVDVQLKFYDQLHTESEKRELKERLDNIVKNGYELLESPMVIGITNISAPIFDHSSSVVGAITVPYLPQKYTQGPSVELTLDKLKKMANQISVNLGKRVE